MALNLPGKAHPIYGNFEDRPQDTEDLIMISLITKKKYFHKWGLISIQNDTQMITPDSCVCRSRREWAVRQYFQPLLSQDVILIHSKCNMGILQVQSLYLQHIRALKVIAYV